MRGLIIGNLKDRLRKKLTSTRAETDGGVAPDGHRRDKAKVRGPIEVGLFWLRNCGSCT